MKTKKIEIHYKGEYICTTMRARTCKEALSHFMQSPCLPRLNDYYKPNYYNDLTSNCIDVKKLRACIVREDKQ